MRENGTHTNTESRAARAVALFATIMLLMAAGPASAGPTAAQKCEAKKNQTSGKYAACAAKAEKGLVLKGDVEKYSAALGKCATKIGDGFMKLEAKGGCPTSGDAGAVQGFLDGCTQSVAQALADGTPFPDCEVSAGGVVATGQTTSYGAESDGAEQRGVARSFTDNGDGTITDNVTGLMWEKKSADGSIHDLDNVYTWGMDTPPYTMNGTMVTTFLAALNSGGGFAGYTDWRIPNIQELHTLVNFEEPYPGPVTFTEFNDNCMSGCMVTTCSCTVAFAYWSTSTYQFAPYTAWHVSFNNGTTFADNKAFTYYVRAVRAGS